MTAPEAGLRRIVLLICLISLPVSAERTVVERPTLRIDSGLAQVPPIRPTRPAPPPLEQVEALAAYYFEDYPELDVPDEVIERLARYYGSEQPQIRMPAPVLEAVVRYYRARPQLRPPAGLHHRMESGGAPWSGERPTPSVPVAVPLEPNPEPTVDPITVPVPPSIPDPEVEPPIPVQGNPAAAMRLSRTTVSDERPILMMAAVSFEQDGRALQQKLRQLLSRADPDAAVNGGSQTGTLDADWEGVTHLQASLHGCPAFLACEPFPAKAPVALTPELMTWTWKISLDPASDSSAKADFVTVRFTAYRGDPAGVGDSIDALPPLQLRFKRECDGDCVTGRIRVIAEVVEAGDKLLGNLRNLLISLAAILTLIAGWLGLKRKKS